MNPQLIALAGPLRGAVWALSAKEFSIGREPSNQLCLDDPLVSRSHAVISWRTDRFELSDLKSANGTMVNGVPVKQRRLEHCDRIAIGSSLFLLLLREDEAAQPPGPVRLDQGKLVTGLTTLLQPEEALYLHVERVLTALPHPERLARDLSALLRISLAINPIRRTQALLQRLLELILEIIPAERAAILLFDKDSEGPSVSASLDRELGPGRPFEVSRTIVHRVQRERIALFSDDVMEDISLGAAASVIASQIRSLLAVPLVVSEATFGVIYLDTRNPDVRLNRDHQELLLAIARIAAVALESARRVELLEGELRRLRSEEHELIGESKPMRETIRLIAKAAPSNTTILIRGESGTGKELAARAIHRASPRANRPFVAVNCAALYESLFESELFGHERGAFTGAVGQKRGLLEAADGGTIFLDEIGELSLALQAKLLRALQEREFLRVGGTRPVKVDVRVIAATNRDLEGAVEEGRFREDLYYRLNVFSITMLPLRERREDILLLARYFLRQFSEVCKRPVRGFTQQALDCLLRHNWPGNVRELANAVERAVLVSEDDFIQPSDLPDKIHKMTDFSHPRIDSPNLSVWNLRLAIEEFEKQHILRAVEKANGNITAAARLLGIADANNLHRRIRTLDLKPEVDKLRKKSPSKPED